MTDWTIRRAEPADADGLGTCFDRAYARYAARLDDLPPMSEGLAEDIARHHVWVAEAAGAIVGGLVLVPGDGFMLLANVAVHPDHRGMGLGQRLLALAESEAVRRGYAEMRLNTHAAMGDTVSLYARNGWTRQSRQGNRIAMKKALLR